MTNNQSLHSDETEKTESAPEGQGKAPSNEIPKKAPDAQSAPKSWIRKVADDYNQWEKYTVWPMFILSLVFVALTALVISPPADLDRADWRHITLITLLLWALFVCDFLVRLLLSQNRKKFLTTQSFELLTLLIPYLRPFLLIRYMWRLSYFRHKGVSGLQQRAIIAVAMFALFFVYTSSTVVWVVERSAPHANILNWGDAIWWGFVTISTVGYGDYYPVTTAGRLVAVGLMVGGLFVVGVTSATIISAFNNSIKSYLQAYGEAEPKVAVKRGHAIMEAISMGALHDDQVEGGTTAGGPAAPTDTGKTGAAD